MAKELGPRRITANVVAPGADPDGLSGGMILDNPEVNERIAEMTALGRAGVPDDIGPMIAAFLSDGNRWVNGQRIVCYVVPGFMVQTRGTRTVQVELVPSPS
jgi:NAD(P)-dependent dehydrogenase (short-subunit alcohol dehydrogenase family)